MEDVGFDFRFEKFCFRVGFSNDAAAGAVFHPSLKVLGGAVAVKKSSSNSNVEHKGFSKDSNCSAVRTSGGWFEFLNDLAHKSIKNTPAPWIMGMSICQVAFGRFSA